MKSLKLFMALAVVSLSSICSAQWSKYGKSTFMDLVGTPGPIRPRDQIQLVASPNNFTRNFAFLLVGVKKLDIRLTPILHLYVDPLVMLLMDNYNGPSRWRLRFIVPPDTPKGTKIHFQAFNWEALVGFNRFTNGVTATTQ